MSNPDTPKDDMTPLEQTVQNEPTEQLDTQDATRAIEVDARPTAADSDAAVHSEAAVDSGADHPDHAFYSDRAGETVPSAAQATEHAQWPQVVPERPSGLHAPAIVLGLVCLAVAGIVLAQELGSLSVDWGDVGPLGIVVAGAVLVLFGLVGLLTSRRNSPAGEAQDAVAVPHDA